MVGSDSSSLRLLAVHAHPDDESSKGAASAAMYVAQGVDVLVVTCTGGERGGILNPRLADDPAVLADLPAVRRREMAEARSLLGVRQEWLGFVDSGWVEGFSPQQVDLLPDGCFARVPVDEAARPLVAILRKERPHVVTTYDENGGYPHPDHVMTHAVTMAALDACADPAYEPALGPPWEVPKVYYHVSFHRQRLQELHDATVAAGLESPFAQWLEDWDDPELEGNDRVTTRVPCAEFFPVRDDALRAHATQIDPDGWWFSVPYEIQARVWPSEDFQLVRSRVVTPLPEDDLFAGLRGQLADEVEQERAG